MEESSTLEPDEVPVISSNRRQMIEDCSLVLSAKKIRHRIHRLEADNLEIRVPSALYQPA